MFDNRSKIFLFVIMLLIFITLSLDSVWISLGENCCWSLLGLKGVSDDFEIQLSIHVEVTGSGSQF